MHEFFQDTTQLLNVVAWPTTVLIALAVLRSQIRMLLTRFTDAIAQAAQISIGKKGLEIKLDSKITAVNSRILALKAGQDQVKETVYRDRRSRRRIPPSTASAAGASEIPPTLLEMATSYLKVDIPDWRQRVARKNELALQMGNVVITECVSRDRLAQSTDEGLHLALAAAIAADPDQADLDRILRVVPITSRLHVRYKLVVALLSLINQGLVQQTDVAAAEEALRRMSINADEPLQRVIAAAGTLIHALGSGELTIDP
jgi:hypothetical protein